jgi:hypothetical protein
MGQPDGWPISFAGIVHYGMIYKNARINECYRDVMPDSERQEYNRADGIAHG